MGTTCVHSCKGLCNALRTAEQREREAIAEYARFQAECDYPEVRTLLGELIKVHEGGLDLLAETRNRLEGVFDSLDRITESFR